jgi:hypothetical protein
MTHNRKAVEPTCVSRVEKALQQADDFLTAPMIRQAAAMDKHHVETCLWHLAKYQAIDSIRSGDELWWFLTPERDLRARKVAERAKEDKPRKPRRSRIKPIPFPLDNTLD